MDLSKSKLAEKMLLFLYSLSENSRCINLNTYKRYIYLYYLTSSFLSGASDNVDIAIEKGDIKIINFDSIMSDFNAKEYIDIEDNLISVNQELINLVSPLLKNESGAFHSQYKEIQPFVNLLQSYSDQFVFTVFFSEPTFKEASLRGIKEMQSSDSRLSKLLGSFKAKLNNAAIDEYDILTYWMDYILKNYYIEMGENGAES